MKSNGAALKAIRVSLGWTLERLAEAAGSSKTHLSQVETGVKNASPALLRRLAEVLDVPVAAISSPHYRLDRSA